MTNPGFQKTDTTLVRQIHCFRRTRDLLLPCLRSGALDVSEPYK